MNPQVEADSQYQFVKKTLPEIEHKYGSQVHILADTYLLTLLAELSCETTRQPLINEYVSRLYAALLTYVINHEFPTITHTVPTRMRAHHPDLAYYRGPYLDPQTKVVSVNLARAGTLPSHVCFSTLTYALNPDNVRQDHVSIARTTGRNHEVTGSEVAGHKIGGPVDGAIVLFPDPMGATGSTMHRALELYSGYGTPEKTITLNLIVTPEYIKEMTKKHPSLIIYALRLDRGLSSGDTLKTMPGTHWDRERGLNEMGYIVPGAGGVGEILNNAFV